MRRAVPPAADAEAAVTLRYAVFNDAPDLLRLASAQDEIDMAEELYEDDPDMDEEPA